MGRIVRASCEIKAPIERVWRILVDVESYHRWNPFIVAVRCAGSSTVPPTRMHFEVCWRDGGRARSQEQVRQVSPPRQADDSSQRALWVYDYVSPLGRLGLLHARRRQELVSKQVNSTVYRTEERFSGILSAFVPYAKVQHGFEDQAAALKQIAESEAMR